MAKSLYKLLTTEMLHAERPSLVWKQVKSSTLHTHFPELIRTSRLRQRFGQTVFDHTMQALDCLDMRNEVTLWAIVFHDTGKISDPSNFAGHETASEGFCRDRLSRLGAPKLVIASAAQIVATHMWNIMYTISERSLRHFIGAVGIHNLDNWLIVRMADVNAYGNIRSRDLVIEFKNRLNAFLASLNTIESSSLAISDAMITELLGSKSNLLTQTKDQLLTGIRSCTYPNTQQALIEALRSIYQ